MELLPRNATENRSISNNMSTGLTTVRCYSLYEESRTLYIPIFHALVMIAGLIANTYVIIALHCLKTANTKSRKALADLDFMFSHLGLCNIATVLNIPVWVTQSVSVRGWVFGYMVCKVVKGLNTFCFQYGIFLMVYINLERYMRVVHNRPMLKHLADASGSTARRTVCRICAIVPAVSACVDIGYYTVSRVSENTMVCSNNMYAYSKIITYWVRMNLCFILPLAILLYCNGMVVYTVRKHLKKQICGKKMKRVQILPCLTAALFMCCWMPWIGSTLYYHWHVGCVETMHVILNVSVGIGNMHCITSPILYIAMRTRNTERKRNSFRCRDPATAVASLASAAI